MNWSHDRFYPRNIDETLEPRRGPAPRPWDADSRWRADIAHGGYMQRRPWDADSRWRADIADGGYMQRWDAYTGHQAI